MLRKGSSMLGIMAKGAGQSLFGAKKEVAMGYREHTWIGTKQVRICAVALLQSTGLSPVADAAAHPRSVFSLL